MMTEEYKSLWKQALHLSEMESNKDKATMLVNKYYNHNELFTHLDEQKLLVVFAGLVVYEEKFHLNYGSTSPAAWCYQEILSRLNKDRYERNFIYDIGDWAAKYSTNPYVPMGTRRGFGPRAYLEFEKEQEKRTEEHMQRMVAQKAAKEKRLKKRIEESKQKINEAKKKRQVRLKALQNLRNKNILEALSCINKSKKPIFYFIELVEEWFANGNLNDKQKEMILSLFPSKSTRHNMRKKKELENSMKI